MSLQIIKDQLQDYAKDIKLNLSTVLTEEGAPGLSQKQIYGIALSSAYQTKNTQLVNAILEEAADELNEADFNAAKIAATLMAMNNTYYRFSGTAKDPEFKKMPAKLRMTAIGNPGVDKVDFELYSLAVSALNYCNMCINSHIKSVKEHGITNEGVQSTARIASVIGATAQALAIN